MRGFGAYLDALYNEGGNTVVGGIGSDKINVAKYGRGNVRDAIAQTLRAINKASWGRDKALKPIWNDADIESGAILTGSGGALFDVNGIDDKRFVRTKPTIGDVDVQLDGGKRAQLRAVLIPGTQFGPGLYKGINDIASQNDDDGDAPSKEKQLNTQFEYNMDGETTRWQFDFEFVDFGADNRPTAWSQFSHSSSWKDAEARLKGGILHKYLLRAMAWGKTVSIKKATPAGTKLKDETLSALSFSVDNGLRSKFLTLKDYAGYTKVPAEARDKFFATLAAKAGTGMDEDELRQSTDIFIELPTQYADYEKDLNKIMKALDISATADDDISSYTGLLDLLDAATKGKAERKQRITTTFDNFLDLLFGGVKQGQEIENPVGYPGANPDEKAAAAAEVDVGVKRAGAEYFIKKFETELGSKRGDVEARIAKWKQGYGSKFKRIMAAGGIKPKTAGVK